MKHILYAALVLIISSCGSDEEEGVNPIVSAKSVSGPFDVLVYKGGVASFAVSAEGSDLKYLWYKNGVADSSDAGRSASYTVVPGSADSGDLFRCYVYNVNSKGEVTSSFTSAEGMLSIIEPPVIQRLDGMVFVPTHEGPFVCGSEGEFSSGNESPVHSVLLSHSFWMDSVEVSKSLFSKVMKKMSPIVHYSMPWGSSSVGGPATDISWNDAVMYCNAVSRMNGVDSAYEYTVTVAVDTNGSILSLNDSLLIRVVDGVKDSVRVGILDTFVIIPADTILPVVTGGSIEITPVETLLVVPHYGYALKNVRARTEMFDKVGVCRLPTEAEWEFAARARSGANYYWGVDVNQDYSWYKDNSAGVVHVSGTSKPNLYGLYDMSGNVWEWCSDFYGNYGARDVSNPVDPLTGTSRVLRGGSYQDLASYVRSSQRGSKDPASRSPIVGFRTIRIAEGK